MLFDSLNWAVEGKATRGVISSPNTGSPVRALMFNIVGDIGPQGKQKTLMDLLQKQLAAANRFASKETPWQQKLMGHKGRFFSIAGHSFLYPIGACVPFHVVVALGRPRPSPNHGWTVESY